MSTTDEPIGGTVEPPEPQQKGSVLAKMATAGFALAPTNFEEAWRIAQMLSQSAFAPAVYRGKPNDCLAAMAYGQEVGLSPLQALQGVIVINGRPSLWGDFLLGIVRANPAVLSVNESIAGEGDDIVATCTIRRRRGAEVEETTRTFSVGDAKVAKLWGKKGKDGQDTPWVTYPKRMLQMRARSWAVRDSCADITKGVAMAEEQMDAQEMRNVTPVIERERDDIEDRIDSLVKGLGWKRAHAELERKNYSTREAFIEAMETEIAAKANRPARGEKSKPAPAEEAPTPAELLLSKDQLSMLMAFLGALEIGAPDLTIPAKDREAKSREQRIIWAQQNGIEVPIDPSKGRASFSMLTEVQAAKLIDVAKKDAIACGLVNTTMLECAACGVKPDYIHKAKCPEIGA